MSKIEEKLLQVQAELKVPKNNFNSFGKYKYRSCEDILEAAKPIFVKHGLLLTLSDEVVAVGPFTYVKTEAWVYLGEESMSCSAMAREAIEKKGMDASQITGTASSYARKIALSGLLCLDDTKDSDAKIVKTGADFANKPEPEAKTKDELAIMNEKLGTTQATWEDLLSWMESQPVIKNGTSTVTKGPLTEAVSAMKNKKTAKELCGFLVKYFGGE